MLQEMKEKVLTSLKTQSEVTAEEDRVFDLISVYGVGSYGGGIASILALPKPITWLDPSNGTMSIDTSTPPRLNIDSGLGDIGSSELRITGVVLLSSKALVKEGFLEAEIANIYAGTMTFETFTDKLNALTIDSSIGVRDDVPTQYPDAGRNVKIMSYILEPESEI